MNKKFIPMSSNSSNHRIKSFTILEALVVIAMIGLLISIITSSLNNFSKQLKVTSDISDEITSFRLLRSTIWSDLYNSDSTYIVDETIYIKKNEEQISYSSTQGRLVRHSNNDVDEFNVFIDKIGITTKDENHFVSLNFILGGQNIEMIYPLESNLKQRIQHYFNKKNLNGK